MSDAPERSEAWRGRLHVRRGADGALEVLFAEIPPQDVVLAADAQTAEHKEDRP